MLKAIICREIVFRKIYIYICSLRNYLFQNSKENGNENDITIFFPWGGKEYTLGQME